MTAKKRKKAVALQYDPGRHGAPVMVGKGAGQIAEKILAIARQYNIPIHEDADLTEVLAKLNLHQQIPPETYVVVAELLAFLYRTNRAYGRGGADSPTP